MRGELGSNNTNKLSPQEQQPLAFLSILVQIIQINLVLKNVPTPTNVRPCVQIIQINLVLKNLVTLKFKLFCSSNNTNKLSPQEHRSIDIMKTDCSNNTNKLSPQELGNKQTSCPSVQIIQINLVLKN